MKPTCSLMKEKRGKKKEEKGEGKKEEKPHKFLINQKVLSQQTEAFAFPLDPIDSTQTKVKKVPFSLPLPSYPPLYHALSFLFSLFGSIYFVYLSHCI